MQSHEIPELIKRAAERAGSKSELGRQLGATPQRIYEWETGRRSCPPEDVALMADLAGLPAEVWLARATMWKHEGTPKGERLQKALGKYSRVIGAALALCLALVAGMATYDRSPVFLSR